MERMYIIFVLFALNALYWGHLSVKWNETSSDGVTGRSFIGVFLTGMSLLVIFNLDWILNPHA